MKKVAVILFLSVLSLGNVSAMNGGHVGGRGSYGGGGFHGSYHGGSHGNSYGGFHNGYYGHAGYRGGYYRGGYNTGFYGGGIYVPVWVPGYWIYDNYGNQIQWVNGYYR